jgi:hypothetical protein
VSAPLRRAPALLRSVGEHLARLSERLHLDQAANDREVTKYAKKTLASAGFQVTEESWPRKTWRPIDRRKATAIWLVGAALTGAATYALQYYWKIFAWMWPHEQLPIFAIAGFTFLLDRWLTRPTIDAPSTNLVAVRGNPRLWLVAYLDPEEEVPRSKRVEFSFLLAAGVALLIADPFSWSGKIMYATVALVAISLWSLVSRWRSKHPAERPLAPVTGATAVLGAIEQISPNREIGVLLSRGLDPDKRGIRFGLAGRGRVPAVIVGDVGAPGRIQVNASVTDHNGIAMRIKSAASEEEIPLIVQRPLRDESAVLRMFTDNEFRNVELFRTVYPFRYWQQRVGFNSGRSTDAKLEPAERVAIVSRLLARVVEQAREEKR